MPADQPNGDDSQESGEVLEDAGLAGAETQAEEDTNLGEQEGAQEKRTLLTNVLIIQVAFNQRHNQTSL